MLGLARIDMTVALIGLAACGIVSAVAVAQEARLEKAGKPEKTDKALRAADSDSPLPEGWPGATTPGTIEVKAYPAYRSAIAEAKGASAGSSSPLFFSLFNHISKSGIEMTAPVVSTFKTPAMVETPRARGDMTMEFLYRNTREGQTGKGVGAVVVNDHPAQSFVAIGLVGPMSDTVLRESVAKLHGWLSEHKAQWVEDGPSRWLGYHGPMTPAADRRWEVQIPVKPAPAAPTAGASGQPASR